MDDIRHQTNKVGVIPYRYARTRGGEDTIEYLVYLPQPKITGEEDQMQWGLARGTVREIQANGSLKDIRDGLVLKSVGLDRIEDHWKTARTEAWEELGIPSDQILQRSVKDHGLVNYFSQDKGRYPIHFYSFEVSSHLSLDDMNGQAQDAQKVAWKSLDELREMASKNPYGPPNEHFKAAYLDVLEQVERDLPHPARAGGRGL